jgi:plastocyanin
MFALAAASVIAAAACSSDDGNKTRTLGTLTFTDHGTKDVKGKSDVEFEADSNYFAPTFLRGNPGQKLTLKVENESSTLHNFSLTAQQVDQDLPGKGKAEIVVTFPQSGVVRFFCKIHADQGMNGELLVGDAAPQAAS